MPGKANQNGPLHAAQETTRRDKYQREFAFDLPPVTDRVLATEVLERGEMLTPRKPENWHRLHIFARRNTAEDAEQEPDPRVAKRDWVRKNEGWIAEQARKHGVQLREVTLEALKAAGAAGSG